MGNLFRSPSIRTRRSGFTLLEAVLLVVILSVISLGASIGMQSAAKIPASVDNLLALNRQVASTMEQLKASRRFLRLPRRLLRHCDHQRLKFYTHRHRHTPQCPRWQRRNFRLRPDHRPGRQRLRNHLRHPALMRPS